MSETKEERIERWATAGWVADKSALDYSDAITFAQAIEASNAAAGYVTVPAAEIAELRERLGAVIVSETAPLMFFRGEFWHGSLPHRRTGDASDG